MTAHKWVGCTLSFVLLLGFVGCGSSTNSSGGGASMDQLAGTIDAQKAARQSEATAAAQKAEADRKASEQPQAAQPTEPVKKAVGSRPPLEGGGYLRAIAGARRHVMNVVDNLAWIQGVRSFKAEEGRKPKSNEEFMKVVVPRYDLQLPRIEADQEYLYDPNGETDGDFGQLYVVEKQQAPASSSPAPK